MSQLDEIRVTQSTFIHIVSPVLRAHRAQVTHLEDLMSTLNLNVIGLTFAVLET